MESVLHLVAAIGGVVIILGFITIVASFFVPDPPEAEVAVADQGWFDKVVDKLLSWGERLFETFTNPTAKRSAKLRSLGFFMLLVGTVITVLAGWGAATTGKDDPTPPASSTTTTSITVADDVTTTTG